MIRFDKAFIWTMLASFSVLTACRIEDTTPPKAAKNGARECLVATGTKPSELAEIIDSALHSSSRRCIDTYFEKAKEGPHHDKLEAVARRTLGHNNVDNPSKVGAISYLTLYAADSREVIDRNIALLRDEARSGVGRSREVAISSLATRRSDDDLPIFRQGVLSEDEGVLVYSLFALVGNCSRLAQEELRSLLATRQVQTYIEKYRERESITKTIRQSCPL